MKYILYESIMITNIPKERTRLIVFYFESGEDSVGNFESGKGSVNMCPYDLEIEYIKNQLIKKYNPTDIILFGSCARGRVTRSSDVDICIILETEDKRKIVRDILIEVEYNIDLDVVVYTPQEWQNTKNDRATFAGIIKRTGVSLIG